MSYDAAESEMTALLNLGRKIGIAGLATPDFDLVCANAYAVDRFCDQFESIELTPKERFHFMQLIVVNGGVEPRDFGGGARFLGRGQNGGSLEGFSGGDLGRCSWA